MKKQRLEGTTMAIGSMMALAIAISSGIAQAGENPFSATHLESGYQLAQADTKSEEGKCGEAKCGAKEKSEKDAEGKCGEGKCGAKEDESKGAEGKCGEAKCGGEK